MNTDTLPLFDRPYAPLKNKDNPFEPFSVQYGIAFGYSYTDYFSEIGNTQDKNQTREYFAAYSCLSI